MRRTKLSEVCGIVLSVMLFFATAFAASLDLADGLCFYLPFDDDANALVAKGNPMEMLVGIDAVFVEGKVGKAVHCGEGGKHRYLSYLTVSPNFAPNIRPEAGTLAFWVRPDWDGDEPVERYRHFFSVRSGLFYLYWHRGGLVFSSTMRKMARHLYAPSTDVRHWRKGEWHHIAASWQVTDQKERKGFKRLYIDGQKVAEVSDVFLDFELTGALIVGGIDGELQRIADAAIDEFVIWERVLADEEIRQVWMMGEKGMALAQLPAVQKLAQQTRQRIQLTIPPQTGNLLANSSFEVGSLHPWRASNMTLKPDETEKVHGNRSARFLVLGRTILTCGLFVARPQVAHTLSLWLKSEREGVRVHFGVNSAYVAGTYAYGPIFRGIEGQGILSTDWQRYTVTGILPPSPNGFYFVRAVFESTEPTNVWVDAVQVEEGEKATPFKMRQGWEAGLATDKPFNLFHPDEPVLVRLEIFSEGKRHQPLQIDIHDVWEKKVLSRQVRSQLKVGLTVLPLSFRLPLGSYRISVADEKGKVMDELVIAVLPRFENLDERMGIHVGANETGVMLAKALSCGWVRLLDACGVTHWNVVEPEKGKWAWERTRWLDEAIETYRNAGLKILGLLFRTPLWASSGDSVNHPPKDLEAWRTYVRSVAQHFKGRIDAYEVWNEPYGLSLFTGKEDLYLQMTRIAFEELRKVDPQVKVVAPCTYWSLDDIVRWTEGVLQRGLLEFVDVFSFHGYDGYRPTDFERIKRWSTADGKQRPLWNTEQGLVSESFYRFLPDAYDDPYTRWIATRPFSAREAAAAMVKAFVSTLMLCWEGKAPAEPKKDWEDEAPAEPKNDVKFFQYWAVPEDTMLPRLKSMSLLEFDNALRPKAVAFAIAGWLLRDCKPEGFEHRNGLWLLHFRQDKRSITVAWSEEGMQTLALPEGAEVLTMMGNLVKFTGGKIAVGSEPIFVRWRREVKGR